MAGVVRQVAIRIIRGHQAADHCNVVGCDGVRRIERRADGCTLIDVTERIERKCLVPWGSAIRSRLASQIIVRVIARLRIRCVERISDLECLARLELGFQVRVPITDCGDVPTLNLYCVMRPVLGS